MIKKFGECLQVSRLSVVAVGVAAAVLVLALGAGNALVFYNFTNAVVDKVISLLQPHNLQTYALIGKDFNLSFETAQEMNVFEAQNAGVKLSDKIAKTGTHSLLVEFPPEAEYPGLTFDLFGKECLNWSKMKEFSFDVYNSIELETGLTIQIRSGEKYPKKEFKKDYTVAPLQWSTIRISRDELARELDLGKVSHLTIFMPSVPTTFRLYFDNMRVRMAEDLY